MNTFSESDRVGEAQGVRRNSQGKNGEETKRGRQKQQLDQRLLSKRPQDTSFKEDWQEEKVQQVKMDGLAEVAA